MACPKLKMNDGREMPVVGLGTYLSKDGEVQRAVGDAINAGYRHFDCAFFYENEAEVGAGIKAKIDDGSVKREDIFVVSKIWNTFHPKEMVVPTCRKTLQNLGLDYIDLFLIHWPMAWKEGGKLWPEVDGECEPSDIDYLETWQGMEECVKLGLAKSIGVSNFNSQQIDRLLANCKIRPVNNQVEVNPNLNQKKLIQFCKSRSIVVSAYCPLGGPAEKGDKPKPSSEDAKVIEIGKKYNKSPAQIILKYLISLGVAVLPKSVTKSRIEDNINLFDFKLSDEEMAYMDSLHTGNRVVTAKESKNHKYFPFGIEY